MNWKGVTPAITTPWNGNLTVDHGFLAEHSRWLIENGCTGVVALGSLGEGATLSSNEKLGVLRTLARSVNGVGTLVASISSLTTAEAVMVAQAAADLGCSGLMVLPPYVYLGDWREMRAHLAAVFRATSLPCMLYNNPIAYGTDFLPEQIQELSQEFENFKAALMRGASRRFARSSPIDLRLALA
jgi:dihydrodipicolinate synthase/N-acetylneuraminate lyase